ncbi:hypothetical protein GY31_12340 [Lysinibacillus sphaericus]|uniref:hypothetical protein n=1 Tax=Lysinibacillus TaxID=400634 RepID=UPI00084AA6AC|nr:hypothetical protein [Lysinibacillus sphaericus]OEC01591.1 hypothetical protein GY31_12340 [Lysinibacillus sphaericus]
MRRYAQIVDNKAYWIFEEVKRPPYPDDLLFIDITGRNDIQEGWDYNSETGEFTAPVIPEPTPIEPQPTVEEMQAQTLLNTEYLVSRSELGLGGN